MGARLSERDWDDGRFHMFLWGEVGFNILPILMLVPGITPQVVESVAALNLIDRPAHFVIPLAQTKHRFEIISKWKIPPGSRVLEIGCGQGDCTAVLAHTVGHEGHVTAIDPGPINTYGSPFTLAQSQAHLSAGPLGSRITWVEADPIQFLESHPEEKYDFAVLVHCIWYFASPTTLENILGALTSHTPRIAIAEWALSTSFPNATPHILAAFAQADIHWRKPDFGNIRTLLSPTAIKEAGSRCGMMLQEEHVVVPAPLLQDAGWEVGDVISVDFQSKITQSVESEQERCVLNSLRDAVKRSKEALTATGERVRCMDVWTGVLHVA